jgi:hypothetical protein
MERCFARWGGAGSAGAAGQEEALGGMAAAMAKMPESLRAALTEIIPATWSEAELKALGRALKERTER